MKSIHTLIPDIYELVGGQDGLSDVYASDLAVNIQRAVQTSLGPRESRGLRLSGLGPKCPRHLWYSIHRPDLAEPIPPYARIKYLYGHILEHLLIGLAKAAGHEVTGEQDELTVDGVTGHRDCVIDGAVCDIKSTSSRSFQKFKDKTLSQSDDFGYLEQLDAYAVGSLNDPAVSVKDRAYILAVDKTLGHLTLYEHKIRNEHIKKRIRQYKQVVELSHPPACQCGTKPHGESGNITLDVKASYSPYKHLCFPELRTFLYSNGPVFLTKVVNLPKVPELNVNQTMH